MSQFEESNTKSFNKKINRGKYWRLAERSGVLGFVVNIHDIINFDLDLDIFDNVAYKYEEVVTSEYVYTDLGPDLNNTDPNRQYLGYTYRCRLRGIGINHQSLEKHSIDNLMLSIRIKQMIDSCEGWIIVTLSDIDIYKRLLVDIYVPLSREYINMLDLGDYIIKPNNPHVGMINLKDYILQHMTNKIDPLYYAYGSQ